MSLKFNISDIASVPEEFRSLYKETESGGYQLNVEGATSKDKLNEFRQRNVTLMKEKEAFDKKMAEFDGIDMDEYKSLKKAAQELADKKMIEAGQVDELVDQRVSAMRDEMQKTIDTLSGDNKSLHGRLEGLIIDGAAKDAALAAGIAPSAVEDVLYRVRNTFSLNDDKAIPKDSDGNVIYSADGATPLTIKEWVGGLAKSAPHLFAKSSGSDTPDSTSAGGGNSISRDKFDAMSQPARASFFQKGGVVVD